KENLLKMVLAGEENKFDKNVTKILDTYYTPSFKRELEKEIGITNVDLIRKYREESNIGNLICDALREWSGADIAFYNSGGIRIDINKGVINMELVHLLLPFDNTGVVMELAGTQILEVLEQSATLEKGVLQQSGLKVKYDIKKPIGKRVVEVCVGDTLLSTDKIYRVATNDFLAAGGDNFLTFKKGKKLLSEKKMVRDIFVEYLKKQSPISPQVEGRIIIMR
ncbi:MAG: 5'-nucleotidase C-terminal domain-containing protein, partial [Chitinispirillaceae bacterium]|nr:5'-nucleotidase C-terminal domain-containing protein [Chitinispirillaceae bacterium]